jgi:hypothetical protein
MESFFELLLELSGLFLLIKFLLIWSGIEGGGQMKDRKKALEAWKEDHFGSSEGFESEWEAETKESLLEVWEGRFLNDEADLY